MQKPFDFIILGSGLSGLMLAHKMSQDPWFAKKRIAIIDQSIKNQNDRTWCFWALPQHYYADIVSKQWSHAVVANHQFKKSFDLNPYTYQMIRSQDFYLKILTELQLKNNFCFITDEILTVKAIANIVTLNGKNNVYEGYKLFNSTLDIKPLFSQKKYAYLKQHFVGWFVKTANDCFNEHEVHFMNFDIPQQGNTRFMYILPLSKNEALFEYTLFSEDLLPFETYEQAIKTYLEEKNITNYHITEKEQGNIPMTCYPFHKNNSSNILYIGSAGGWTKASTGFTFSKTLETVDKLVSFIKKQQPLNQFYQPSRFWLYDLNFLEVLKNHNHRGAEIFTQLFQKNKTKTLLDFLDEKTTISQELKIMTKVPMVLFTKNLLQSFYKILKYR